MLMSMSIVNDTVKLLTNINNGTNTLIINNSTVPESSWVGDGYYTVGNIRIQKISANTGNIHLIKINDLNYKLATKNTSSRIFASDVVYDNTTSGTQEDDVQGALDELYDKLDDMHPVGSIYLSVTSTNPSTYFGGTWVRISEGRVLVGVDENDTDFNTPEKTSGNKTANLYHSHSLSAHTHGMQSHTHSISGHTHGLSSGYAQLSGTGNSIGWRYKTTTSKWNSMWALDGNWGGAWTQFVNFGDGVALAGTTDGAASTAKTGTPSNNTSPEDMSSFTSIFRIDPTRESSASPW